MFSRNIQEVMYKDDQEGSSIDKRVNYGIQDILSMDERGSLVLSIIPCSHENKE
jgi:hypothetical protein